jgi:hypothetical protein
MNNSMNTVRFDGIEWDICEIPCGSSTPDEFVEFWHKALARCPHCGTPIHGMAYFIDGRLDNLEYGECENCWEEEECDE